MSKNNLHNGKKPHARNNTLSFLPLLSALGIIIAALIIWAVIYINTVSAPVIDTNERNPFTRVVETTLENTGNVSDTEEPDNTTDPGISDDPPKTEVKPPVQEIKVKDEFYNILLCGRDFLGSTTDTMMVLSYDVKHQKVNILQILRDTCIIDTSDENKERRVNSVFTYAYTRTKGNTNDKIIGGMEAAERVVEDTFGIVINKYVYIDLNGFKEIVDAVGGVGITIQQDMFYEDPGQDLYIDLKAGYQVLNGDKALDFVRFRSGYAEGDLGRVDAQKIFLSAFVKKLLSAEVVGKLPQLMKTIREYMTTNLTTNDCTYFIKYASRLSLDNILMYTTPGQYYRKSNGAYYYSLYTKENLEIINKGFNCMTADITEKNITLKQIVRDNYDRISTEGKSISDLVESPPNIIFNK
ncbi:MAG: LytR family transcriptional regulator [Ruminococcaceae bacterium]|nr:LytR family transcriptional regulator [Oscillospiraceae bacterium]